MIAMDLSCVVHLACGPDSQKALFDGIVGAVAAALIAVGGVILTLLAESRRRRRDELESMIADAMSCAEAIALAEQQGQEIGSPEHETALTQFALAIRRLFLRPRITGNRPAELLMKGASGLAAARSRAGEEGGRPRLASMVAAIDFMLREILDGKVKRKSTWKSLLVEGHPQVQGVIVEFHLDDSASS